MAREHIKDLQKFLKPFDKQINETVLWLREFIWDHYPDCNELIYDNYNALAIGWSPTDRVGHTFCSIAIGRTSKNIHFGFYWGSQIADPEKKLIGQGNQYRYFQVESISSFPKKYMKKLMKDAHNNSIKKIKDETQLMNGKTITKSISTKKREIKKTTQKK